MPEKPVKTKAKMRGQDLTLTFDQVEFQASDDNPNEMTVSLVARTDSKVDTWYGPMVHELKGVFHKKVVPLDWRHDHDELIGYLDTFKVDNDRLQCSGKVVSVEGGDRPSRIINQAKAGIPFEASIFFGGQGLEVEEIPAEKEVTVNGKRIEGPALVVRKWPLRGVALCPYGRDNQTSVSARFSEEDITLTLNSHKENPMSTESNKAAEAEALKIKELEEKEKKLQDELKLKEEKEKEKKELAEKNKVILPTSTDGKTGSDFITAYGEKGAVWFAEGKTFAEAGTLYTHALEERVQKLEKKLTTIDTGSSEPADSSEPANDEDPKKAAELAERAEKEKKLTPKIGPRLAKFAAGIRLPKRQN